MFECHEVTRAMLHRRIEKIQLPAGKVQVKIAQLEDGREKMMPEYRDCQSIAKKIGKPVREVIATAINIYKQTTPKTARRGIKDFSLNT